MNVTTLMTKLQILQDTSLAFVEWQAMLERLITSHPGFVSLEITQGHDSEWLVVQRFSNLKALVSWQKSERCKRLLQEVQPLLKGPLQEIEIDPSSLKGGVTEVFVTEAKAESDAHFQEWLSKIHLAEAQFAGFRGVYVQSPTAAQGKYWITLLQFDTPENLDRWLCSDERKALLEEAKSLINSLEKHRMISPYNGWFSSLTPAARAISIWKETMVILLLLYPIVMLQLKYLIPNLQPLGPALSTFIGNSISVTLISWPLMPVAIFCLGWWLLPKQNARRKTLYGTIFVCLLYLVEVLFFWDLLPKI